MFFKNAEATEASSVAFNKYGGYVGHIPITISEPSAGRHMIGASSGRVVSVTYYTIKIAVCKVVKFTKFL